MAPVLKKTEQEVGLEIESIFYDLQTVSGLRLHIGGISLRFCKVSHVRCVKKMRVSIKQAVDFLFFPPRGGKILMLIGSFCTKFGQLPG